MTPSLVAHQLLLEDPEIRRCGFQTHPVRAGRFQMSQWGLAGFHSTRGTAKPRTRVPAAASARVFALMEGLEI